MNQGMLFDAGERTKKQVVSLPPRKRTESDDEQQDLYANPKQWHRADEKFDICLPDFVFHVIRTHKRPARNLRDWLLERRASRELWKVAAKVRALRSVAPMEVEE